MTSPRDDERVDAPLLLQPVVARPEGWRGRSGSLIAIGLAGFLVVALVLGTALDDGRPSSSAPIAVASLPSKPPTPRPTARPTTRPEPLATPLPVREVLGGQIPTERRLVYANGAEILDLGSGELTHFPSGIEYPLVPLPNGEVVCPCVIRDFAANGGTGSSLLRFGRYDQAGRAIVERDLRSFDDVVEVPDMTYGYDVAVALDPDAGSIDVLVIERHPPNWTIALYLVDVDTGKVRERVDIGRVPVDLEKPGPSATSATPSAGSAAHNGVYLWVGSVAAAPGGGQVFVSVGRSEVRNDNWSLVETLDWVVQTDPGGASTVTALGPAAALDPNVWCLSQPTFVDDRMVVQLCAGPTGPAPGALFLRRLGADGASLGDLPIVSPAFDGSYPTSFLVDRSARAVYAWQLRRHVLVRIGVDDGAVTEVTVPATALPDIGRDSGGPGYDRGYAGGDPGLVMSTDGRRLFAIGVAGAAGEAAGVPSGIWVFETESLRLLDHWEPRAYLTSLAASSDGRFVYAAGAAGIDVDGRDNPWPASVTVYDAATGEIQVVYGAVAPDTWISFVVAP